MVRGIDWTTAEVSRERALSVRILGVDEDDSFVRAFRDYADRRNHSTKWDPWGVIKLQGADLIVVGDVMPGSEADLQEALDELVDLGSDIVDEGRRKHRELAAERAGQAAERARVAADMQERFRLGRDRLPDAPPDRRQHRGI